MKGYTTDYQNDTHDDTETTDYKFQYQTPIVQMIWFLPVKYWGKIGLQNVLTPYWQQFSQSTTIMAHFPGISFNIAPIPHNMSHGGHMQ